MVAYENSNNNNIEIINSTLVVVNYYQRVISVFNFAAITLLHHRNPVVIYLTLYLERKAIHNFG